MKKVVSTPNAPAAVGAYSQAIRVGGLLFISGQIPLVPSTGAIVEGDVCAQARQSLENLKAILASEGYTMDDAVKTTVLLEDINDFAAVNDVYAEYFVKDCPARACFAVDKLPKGAKVEIELIAYKVTLSGNPIFPLHPIEKNNWIFPSTFGIVREVQGESPSTSRCKTEFTRSIPAKETPAGVSFAIFWHFLLA